MCYMCTCTTSTKRHKQSTFAALVTMRCSCHRASWRFRSCERLALGGTCTAVRRWISCPWRHLALEDQLLALALQHGSRSIELKGGKLWYRTVQCTSGSCTCKYGYEGTARNPVCRTERLSPFKDVDEWLRDLICQSSASLRPVDAGLRDLICHWACVTRCRALEKLHNVTRCA